MLIESQALAIYEIKLSLQPPVFHPSEKCNLVRGKSRTVSRLFGVSPRAIRDIWNRRTWCHVTKHLWHKEKDFRTPVIESGESSGSHPLSLKVRPK